MSPTSLIPGPTWNPHHQESILSRLPTLHDQQSLQLIPLQPHLILHSLRYLLFLQSLLPIPKPEFRSGSPNRYGKYLRPMPICAPLISRHLQLLEIRPIRTIRPSIHPMLPAFRPPVTRNEIEELFDRKLSTLKVYVLESEITEAQQAVKSIVELSSF